MEFYREQPERAPNRTRSADAPYRTPSASERAIPNAQRKQAPRQDEANERPKPLRQRDLGGVTMIERHVDLSCLAVFVSFAPFCKRPLEIAPRQNEANDGTRPTVALNRGPTKGPAPWRGRPFCHSSSAGETGLLACGRLVRPVEALQELTAIRQIRIAGVIPVRV